MNCPYCAKEMETGYLRGGSGYELLWTEEPFKMTSLPTGNDFFVCKASDVYRPIAHLCRACGMIHPVPDNCNSFSHGKSCNNGSDAKSHDMSETEERHTCGNNQTGYIKTDFDAGIGNLCDVCGFPRKQIGWDDRQFAAV